MDEPLLETAEAPRFRLKIEGRLRALQRSRGSLPPLGEVVALFGDDAQVLVAQVWLGLKLGYSRGVGSRIGPYELQEELGSGGQGVVYRARDLRLGRTVALKTLRGLGSGANNFMLRFRREAQAASKSDHPGVCAIYGADVEDGVAYIAMRFVEGETLARRLSTSQAESVSGTPTTIVRAMEMDPREVSADPPADPVPTPSGPDGWLELTQALAVVEKAARAIHAVHESGVIHRDVKPGNIMITPKGEVVIMDFGLAREEESGTDGLTRTGDICGTPAYMSPEQLCRVRTHLDRRTDVWSLGVVLYECITLHRPFRATSREGLYRQILEVEPLDPRRINSALPSDLATVVLTALEKDRDRRYQTAEDVADELLRIIRREPIVAKPVPRWTRFVRWVQRNRRLSLAIACAVSLLIVGSVVSIVLSITAQANAARAERALTDWERLADLQGLSSLNDQANGSLWPARPENAERMATWLSAAADLVDRGPQHRVALNTLRTRALALEGAVDAEGHRSWAFADPRDQIRHDGLMELVSAIERLGDEHEVGGATVASMKSRLRLAQSIEDESIGEHAAAWRQVRERVGSNLVYGGLLLEPQLGLVPLGPDPASGLEEFGNPQTGTIPVRDKETGQLGVGEHTGLVFVLIPGGRFALGAQKDDPAGPNYDPQAMDREGPVHSVSLEPFFLSKYEMTQGQWGGFAGARPRSPSYYMPGEMGVTKRNPVEQISWEEATECMRRLHMQLPTEAQWEYACRAGTSTPWWTGAERSSLRGAVNLADRSAGRSGAAWEDIKDWPDLDDGFVAHAPVGLYQANAFGLHDTHGNVWEWCRDWLAPYAASEVSDGDGLRHNSAGMDRVFRGGCFFMAARYARSADRGSGSPTYRNGDLGLRPVRILSHE